MITLNDVDGSRGKPPSAANSMGHLDMAAEPPTAVELIETMREKAEEFSVLFPHASGLLTALLDGVIMTLSDLIDDSPNGRTA